jgi:hypothetical protein
MTDLAKVEITNPLAVFATKGGLDPVIQEVRDFVGQFEPDLSTAKGRKEIASLAAKVSKFKVRLDGMGKDLVADWKAKSKAVDSSRKAMREELDDLKVKARQPLTEWENLEKERVIAHEATVDLIKKLGSGLNIVTGESASIEDMKAYLKELEEIDTDSLEEFELEGRKEKDKAVESLTAKIEAEKQRIAQEEELEQLRKEKEEREAEERRAALEAEIAARAKAEAEEATRKERERLEQEKKDAVQREQQAKQAAEQAERDRKAAEEKSIQDAARAKIDQENAVKAAEEKAIKDQQAKEADEQAEQERREANKQHVGKIRKEAKESLMEFVDEETAKKIVLAIHKNLIRNISITY